MDRSQIGSVASLIIDTISRRSLTANGDLAFVLDSRDPQDARGGTGHCPGPERACGEPQRSGKDEKIVVESL